MTGREENETNDNLKNKYKNMQTKKTKTGKKNVKKTEDEKEMYDCMI